MRPGANGLHGVAQNLVLAGRALAARDLTHSRPRVHVPRPRDPKELQLVLTQDVWRRRLELIADVTAHKHKTQSSN